MQQGGEILAAQLANVRISKVAVSAAAYHHISKRLKGHRADVPLFESDFFELVPGSAVAVNGSRRGIEAAVEGRASRTFRTDGLVVPLDDGSDVRGTAS